MKGPIALDPEKRRTLKGLTGLSLTGLATSLPIAGGAFAGNAVGQAVGKASAGTAPDLAVTLVSSPDVVEDTLMLRNLSNKPITLEKFHANRLVFDGDIVDCNDACAAGNITIPARSESAIQISPQTAQALNSAAGEYLDADHRTDKLPNGTRVVTVFAHMRGRAAVLSTDANVAA